MTDFLLVEQLHRMMGELPRPRLMYRKGIGMRGYFKIYRSFEEYTSAEYFSRDGPVVSGAGAVFGSAGRWGNGGHQAEYQGVRRAIVFGGRRV